MGSWLSPGFSRSLCLPGKCLPPGHHHLLQTLWASSAAGRLSGCPIRWTKHLSALMDVRLPALTCFMHPQGTLISLSAYINERITETSRTRHQKRLSLRCFCLQEIRIISCLPHPPPTHTAIRAPNFSGTLLRERWFGGRAWKDLPVISPRYCLYLGDVDKGPGHFWHRLTCPEDYKQLWLTFAKGPLSDVGPSVWLLSRVSAAGGLWEMVAGVAKTSRVLAGQCL